MTLRWLCILVLLLLSIDTTAGLKTRKVHFKYPVELLQPVTGSGFSAIVGQDKFTCFGNRDYSLPTYSSTLLCMLMPLRLLSTLSPFVPGDIGSSWSRYTADDYGRRSVNSSIPDGHRHDNYCLSLWGSRAVRISVQGSVEFIKLLRLPLHDGQESVELSATRWVELSSETSCSGSGNAYGNQSSHCFLDDAAGIKVEEVMEVPAEPLYLCARSSHWQGTPSRFNISFHRASLRSDDQQWTQLHLHMNILLVLALCSLWLLPYIVMVLSASFAYTHGIKFALTLLAGAVAVLLLLPVMLTARNRRLARLYFNYFFTRTQREESKAVIREKLPLFQAVFFSSCVLCGGYATCYVLHTHLGIDREMRNTLLRTVISTAVGWLVFFLCRSFERFCRDWLWVVMVLLLAYNLDGRLNPLCRDKMMVAILVVLQLIRFLLPHFLHLIRFEAMLNALLPLLNEVTEPAGMPVPISVKQLHRIRSMGYWRAVQSPPYDDLEEECRRGITVERGAVSLPVEDVGDSAPVTPEFSPSVTVKKQKLPAVDSVEDFISTPARMPRKSLRRQAANAEVLLEGVNIHGDKSSRREEINVYTDISSSDSSSSRSASIDDDDDDSEYNLTGLFSASIATFAKDILPDIEQFNNLNDNGDSARCNDSHQIGLALSRSNDFVDRSDAGAAKLSLEQLSDEDVSHLVLDDEDEKWPGSEPQSSRAINDMIDFEDRILVQVTAAPDGAVCSIDSSYASSLERAYGLQSGCITAVERRKFDSSTCEAQLVCKCTRQSTTFLLGPCSCVHVDERGTSPDAFFFVPLTTSCFDTRMKGLQRTRNLLFSSGQRDVERSSREYFYFCRAFTRKPLIAQLLLTCDFRISHVSGMASIKEAHLVVVQFAASIDTNYIDKKLTIGGAPIIFSHDVKIVGSDKLQLQVYSAPQRLCSLPMLMALTRKYAKQLMFLLRQRFRMGSSRNDIIVHAVDSFAYNSPSPCMYPSAAGISAAISSSYICCVDYILSDQFLKESIAGDAQQFIEMVEHCDLLQIRLEAVRTVQLLQSLWELHGTLIDTTAIAECVMAATMHVKRSNEELVFSVTMPVLSTCSEAMQGLVDALRSDDAVRQIASNAEIELKFLLGAQYDDQLKAQQSERAEMIQRSRIGSDEAPVNSRASSREEDAVTDRLAERLTALVGLSFLNSLST